MIPILVTGGAKGLGAEISLQCARKGHDIVVHYFTNKSLALEVAESCRRCGVGAEIIYGDFASLEGINQFITSYLSQFPETKGVVNNVGNYLLASPSQTTNQEWLTIFQTNFFAAIFLIQALVPSLIKHQGSLVNLGVSGLYGCRAMTKATAYVATKKALFFYTQSLAKELAPHSVRANMVSPGYMENAVDLPHCNELPLKRPATLAEVARVVTFLFEAESGYITGQNIEVSGGIGL